MKKIIFKSAMLLIFLASASASAQTSKNTTGEDKFFLGLGAGLDYGGLGIRASYAATKNISAFGGVGYNLVDPAYNAGVMYKFIPHKKFHQQYWPCMAIMLPLKLPTCVIYQKPITDLPLVQAAI
jgi:hypothetical protein